MKRKLIDKLLEWKEDSNRKVLMLYGASGVGKSYLALDFAKSFYDQFIYFDLGNDSSIINTILECDIDDIQRSVSMYQELIIKDTVSEDVEDETVSNSEEVLLIFDNTQLFLFEELNTHDISSKNNILKADCTDDNTDKLKRVLDKLNQSLNYHVIGISSEMIEGFEPKNNISNYILHPLDFEEFLYATGCEWYIETIKVHYETNSKLPDIVHNQLLKLFDSYLETGGMPLVINEYNSTESFYNLSKLHKLIMNAYLYELKNKPNIESLKIDQVFWSMDKQLMKENLKFQYNMIRKGATCGIYSKSISYIQNTFYGLLCTKLEGTEINDYILREPTNYIRSLYNGKNMDLLNVKLYYFDVGLLNSNIKRNEHRLESLNLEGNNAQTLLTLRRLFQTNKRRAIIENYVAITLASNGYPLIYWESNSLAKIEFIIMKEEKIIPIEVRPNNKTRSKNFSVFKNQYKNVEEQIKISTKNFEYSNHVKYVPIYAAFCI